MCEKAQTFIFLPIAVLCNFHLTLQAWPSLRDKKNPQDAPDIKAL